MHRSSTKSFAWIPFGIALAAVAGSAHGAEGLLDPGFGGTGKRRFAFDLGSTDATRRDFPTGLAIAPDGRIVTAGNITGSSGDVRFGIARRMANGGVDITFGFVNGTPGYATRALIDDCEVGGVAVMSDHRVLVAGGSSNIGLVLRYRADGSIDDVPSNIASLVAFQPNGRATRFVDVAALPDGRILAAGSISPGAVDEKRDFLVARFTVDGFPDPTFGGGDGHVTAAFDLTVNANDSAVAMALAPSGAIVVAGTVAGTTNDIGVAVFTPSGEPDPAFLGVLGTPGRTVFEFGGGASDRAVDVAVDALGRIVVGATTDESGTDAMGIARLQPNGLPDATFGPAGRRTMSLIFDPVRGGAVLVDPQRRVYAVASADLFDPQQGPRQVFARRFLENGSPDPAYSAIFYGHEPDASGRDDVAVAAALQGDRLVILSAAQASGANFDFGLARFTSDTLHADGFE